MFQEPEVEKQVRHLVEVVIEPFLVSTLEVEEFLVALLLFKVFVMHVSEVVGCVDL